MILLLEALLLVIECLGDILTIVITGALTCILSGAIVLWTIVKVLGISQILDMEDEEDYILTKDDERILYDDETQE